MDTVKQAFAGILGSALLSSCLTDPNIVHVPAVQQEQSEDEGDPTDGDAALWPVEQIAPASQVSPSLLPFPEVDRCPRLARGLPNEPQWHATTHGTVLLRPSPEGAAARVPALRPARDRSRHLAGRTAGIWSGLSETASQLTT